MTDGQSKKASKRPRRDFHSGRARGSEIKTGNRGARRTRLTEQQKIGLGGGMLRQYQDNPLGRQDTTYSTPSMREPFDPEQARLNKRLYPWINEGS